jgi:hypothetical protein
MWPYFLGSMLTFKVLVWRWSFIRAIYSTYILSATYHLHDLYNLWDLTNSVHMHFILRFKYNVFNGSGQSVMTETFSMCW